MLTIPAYRGRSTTDSVLACESEKWLLMHFEFLSKRTGFYAIGAQGGVDGIVADCALRNEGNTCAIRACIVEGFFIQNIFQAFFGGLSVDMSKLHGNGFEVADECPNNYRALEF